MTRFKEILPKVLPTGAALLLFFIVSALYFAPQFRGEVLPQHDVQQYEGMAKEMAQTLFSGNENAAPEEFTGFGPRFNSQSAENACNILTSAATPDSTDNSSIWLVDWGDYVHGIYPKASKAGKNIAQI